MKNSTVIKILLFLYIVIGTAGIAWYLTPERTDDDSAFSEASPSARKEALKKKPSAVETETQAESSYASEDIPSPADDVFVPDEWIGQIDDFLGRLNGREENAGDTTSEPADDTAIFTKESIPRIIIDTDFASDADDVVAVRLALCLQDAGLADIRGIALSTTYSRSPLAVHALCSQDGYGMIPVAMDTSGNGIQVHTDYVDVMYDMAKGRDDFEQPVQMYRRILAESDTKVNIITLGFLQNIQALMHSAPDQYSPLTGAELIARKVDSIYIVGGNSMGKPSFNFYWTGEKVVAAAREVVRDFPARIVFLQTDLSDDTYCGQFYRTKDSRGQDIVTRALKANRQESGVVAWDVFSVWCAVQDMNKTMGQAFLELEQGTQYVSDTGATKWTADDAGRHYKMYKNAEGAYYSRLMDDMLLQKYNQTHNR